MVFLRTVGYVSEKFCADLAVWCDKHDRGGNGREFNAEMRRNLARHLTHRAGIRVSPAEALDVARDAYSKIKQLA